VEDEVGDGDVAGTFRNEKKKKALVSGSVAWKKYGSRARISSHLALEYGTLTPMSRTGRLLF